MSDLRHKSLDDLKGALFFSKKRVAKLGSQLSGEKVRQKWIEHYILLKTPPAKRPKWINEVCSKGDKSHCDFEGRPHLIDQDRGNAVCLFIDCDKRL